MALVARNSFPIFSRRVHGKSLVYLDNAATTQKPTVVLDAERRYYEQSNANVHRAIHALGEEATAMLESSRATAARFINATDPSEVIFVRNTTEALNAVAFGLAAFSAIQKDTRLPAPLIGAGDTVAVSVMEHHSNFLPWQRLTAGRKARLAVVPFTAEGVLDFPKLQKLLATERVRVLALAHVSNVLGSINPIAEIAKLCRKRGTILVVDGAQAVGHMPVDVQQLGCDFYAFSGHKMYGPMGIGVLWGRAELLDRMEPMLVGGEMVKTIPLKASLRGGLQYGGRRSNLDSSAIYADPLWNDLPWKFEAGTPNVAGAVGLAEACRFLDRIGRSNLRKHDIALTRLALKGLAAIPEVTIFGPRRAEERGGLVAFSVAGVHPHDVSQFLDEQGIAVRSGHHCAEPLHRALGVPATTRVSFGVYTTKAEVRTFLGALRRIGGLFLKRRGMRVASRTGVRHENP